MPDMTLSSQGTMRLALEWPKDPCAIPFFVGKELGFFSQRGITLEIVSPSLMGEWVNSDIPYCLDCGKVDVAVYYMPFALQAMSQGARMKVIGALVKEPLQELTYLEGRGVKTLADLHGKSLGYSFLAAERHFGRFYQMQADLQDIDLHEFSKLGYYTVRGLLTNQVEAIFTFPTLTHPRLEHYGFTPQSLPLSSLGVPHYHELVLVASAFYLRQHPHLAQPFREALAESIAYCQKDPEAAWSLYTLQLAHEPVEEPLHPWEKKAWTLTAPRLAKDQGLDMTCWQSFYQWMREHDLVTSRLCLQDFLECSYTLCIS